MAEPWEEGWFCFKCNEKVTEGDVQLSYLGFRRPLKGPRCPKCELVFITEEIARKLRGVEEQIEDK